MITKISFHILLAFWVAVAGCRSKNGTIPIAIEGNIRNLPDGWVWLTPADRWKVHMDSAISKNGNFIIELPQDRIKEPLLVSLRYQDQRKPGGIATINYSNHLLGPEIGKPTIDAFYIEGKPVKIDGDLSASMAPRIFAGKETEIMLETQNLDFGWIDFEDAAKRKQRIELFKPVIKQNRHSYYLLERLFRFKEQYSKEEFVDLLAMFETDLRHSNLGDSVERYLSRRPGIGQSYPALSLISPNGRPEKFPDQLKPVNMIIFWASWCPPCRKEISSLKELYEKYEASGLQMISISIDEDIKNWSQALQEEKMPWKQLRAGTDQVVSVMQSYNFKDIPFTVFIDSAGKEMKRFSGYDPDSIVYLRYLEEQLPGKN